jgi:hypothetical protein
MDYRNLMSLGQEALNKKDYLNALEIFLFLQESGMIDLIRSESIDGGAIKLDFYDINRSMIKDVIALSGNGQLNFFLQNIDENYQPLPVEALPCTNFCFLDPDNENNVQILVENQTEQEKSLSVYSIVREGERYILRKVHELEAVEHGSYLDVAYKQKRIYVSTSDGLIYQYNGITFHLERVYDAGAVIHQLKTGSPKIDSAIGTREFHPLYQRLLGISDTDGLVLYDIGPAGFQKIGSFGENNNFTDVVFSDVDADGEIDIIACTRNGKVIVYDKEFFQIKYLFTISDELYAITCDDFDFDSKQEILIGGKSGRIYVLYINDQNELTLKNTISTEHSIWSLMVESSGSTNQI